MGSPRPMYAEDCDDETGRPLKNTRQFATTKEKKEKPALRPKITTTRTSKAPSKTNSDSGYSTNAVVTGSETSSSPSVSPEDRKEYAAEKAMKKERRQSMSARRPSVPTNSRPPLSTQKHKDGSSKEHRRSLSVRTDAKPEHYGLQTQTSRPPPVINQAAAPSTLPVRPRALSHAQTYSAGTRPASYHATPQTNNYPPLSNSAFYQPVTPFQAPPPSPAYNNYAVAPPPQQPANDYFVSQEVQAPARSLMERFEPQRNSAYGIRDAPATAPKMITAPYEREYNYSDEEEDYDSSYDSAAEHQHQRKSSIRVSSLMPSRTSSQADSNFSKANSTYSRESQYSGTDAGYSTKRRDSLAMPPPPLPLVKASQAIHRRPKVDVPVYDHFDEYSVQSDYHDEPRPSSRPRRPSNKRGSASYNVGDRPREAERVRIEAANKGKRRQSYYGQSASTSTQVSNESSGYDAKLREAASYQEEIAGPSIPLTAEALRKEQRRQQQAGSTRSTKSSGSRDHSDYRGTQTTRTTRSGDDDENVTIEVTGSAKVRVGDTEIQCEEGGKIQIHREKVPMGSQATISEYQQSEYAFPQQKLLDDRRSRMDKSDRPRMPSSDSYSRVSPRPTRQPREPREAYDTRTANWEGYHEQREERGSFF